MRARFALLESRTVVTLREVDLRNKPSQLVEISAKATVPVLQLADGKVFDESLDVIDWALARHDPGNWQLRRDDMLIAEADGPFKQALDQYKYPHRYDAVDPLSARNAGLAFLRQLNTRLESNHYLSGATIGITDIAIFPFVRQFAATDNEWFAKQPLAHLYDWITRHIRSDAFATVMCRYPRWRPGDEPVTFPI